jgi:hypothetical protein
MFGHATEHSQRKSAGIAALCAAATLLAGVFMLAGPTTKAEALIYENGAITVDTDHPGFLVTIKAQETGYASLLYAFCTDDKTGDGTTGSRADRAMCVLDAIRTNCRATTDSWWPPADSVGGYLCDNATSHDEWEDASGALEDVAAGNECLSVHLGSTESGPYNWTSRDISEDECA